MLNFFFFFLGENVEKRGKRKKEDIPCIFSLTKCRPHITLESAHYYYHYWGGKDVQWIYHIDPKPLFNLGMVQ